MIKVVDKPISSVSMYRHMNLVMRKTCFMQDTNHFVQLPNKTKKEHQNPIDGQKQESIGLHAGLCIHVFLMAHPIICCTHNTLSNDGHMLNKSRKTLYIVLL